MSFNNFINVKKIILIKLGTKIHLYDLKGLCEILDVWQLMGLSHIFGGLGLLFGCEFISFYFGLGLLEQLHQSDQIFPSILH